jgi:hypothetical protein
MRHPKLSTLQGALLLLQYRPFDDNAWALSAETVAVMQELGVHLDCDAWRIPTWEKILRRRLAWNVYAADKWLVAASELDVCCITDRKAQDGANTWATIAH